MAEKRAEILGANFITVYMLYSHPFSVSPTSSVFLPPHLPKFGHATNSNCHHNQIFVNFTKIWSRDQFQLSSRPNFGNFYQKLVMRPIPIVIVTKVLKDIKNGDLDQDQIKIKII